MRSLVDQEPVLLDTDLAPIERLIAEGLSFLDGKRYKSMRRHLTRHGLTPEGYRARYGLPADYLARGA